MKNREGRTINTSKQTLEKPTILVVHPEQRRLRAIERDLNAEEFQVLTAAGGEEALTLLKETPVSVILCDEGIPETGGLGLIKRLREEAPETVRCLLSSDENGPDIQESLRNKDICSVLRAPWEGDDLAARIKECLDHRETREANRQSMKPILAAHRRQNDCRDEDLELSTALLNVLPQAAVVLGDDYRVVLSNDVYNYKISAEIQSRELPEELRNLLEERFQARWGEFRLNYNINRTAYNIRLRPLRNSDSTRAILFFDPLSPG